MSAQARCALVTGAAQRVGQAIALALGQAGFDLGVHFHTSRSHAEQLARQIRSLNRRCVLLEGDLADPGTPSRLVAKAVSGLGRLDLLVNNAAVFERMTLAQFDLAGWDRQMRINLAAPAALCHAAAAHLAVHRGSIVNVADICADRPWPGYLAYCVSKAGLVGLTKALARELAPAVRVNAVSPGIAVFPDAYDAATRDRLVKKVPLQRAGTPEDVAAAVCFLAISGSYITGQVLNVDGGRSMA